MARGELAPKMNRREALYFMGKRTVETGLYVGINVSAIKKADNQVTQQAATAERTAQQQIETGTTLKTKFFAEDILGVAQYITHSYDDHVIAEIVVSSALSNTGIAYLLKDKSWVVDHLTGGGTILASRVADMVSTIAFAKYYADPRFEEYGFDAYSQEANYSLPDHPTPQDVIDVSCRTLAFTTLIGLLAPFVGRNYIGAVPFVVKNNVQAAHMLKTSLDLGDQVKSIIEKGGTKEDIGYYLTEVAKTAEIKNPDTESSEHSSKP